MASYENTAESDEWYTPKYLFDAMGKVMFDMDVASPKDRTYCNVPAKEFITENSLDIEWNGFVWCNPPFGKRNSKSLWLDKMAEHGNGIALVPDRTSTDWWQDGSIKSPVHLQIRGKIRFIKPDGTTGDSPSVGTTLFAYGSKAISCLYEAHINGLGTVFTRFNYLI
jgi:hypothetical protein